jgi:hypothetical protein
LDEPAKGASKLVDLGSDVAIELVFIPPGEFMMGSAPEERAWATGIRKGRTKTCVSMILPGASAGESRFLPYLDFPAVPFVSDSAVPVTPTPATGSASV